jgi:hypothetical protein
LIKGGKKASRYASLSKFSSESPGGSEYTEIENVCPMKNNYLECGGKAGYEGDMSS